MLLYRLDCGWSAFPGVLRAYKAPCGGFCVFGSVVSLRRGLAALTATSRAQTPQQNEPVRDSRREGCILCACWRGNGYPKITTCARMSNLVFLPCATIQNRWRRTCENPVQPSRKHGRVSVFPPLPMRWRCRKSWGLKNTPKVA